MQTVTWSCASRSACAVPASGGTGSRWPGTAVVAAVSSVTSLLLAGFPVAAHCKQPTARRPGRETRRAARHLPSAFLCSRSVLSVSRSAPDVGKPGLRARVSRRWARDRGRRDRLGLLGLPEDLVDLLDLGQQFLRLGHVHAALGAGGARELGGLVEQLVQLRVLVEVRRLEVVGPQHPQVVLDQLGTLFLDEDRAGPELGVRVLLVLFRDGLDGFRLDPGLRRVIDSARQVAVGVGDGLRLEQACEQPHRFPFSGLVTGRPDTTPGPCADTWRDTCTGRSAWSRWPNGPWSPPCVPVTGCWSAGPAGSGPGRSCSPGTRSGRRCSSSSAPPAAPTAAGGSPRTTRMRAPWTAGASGRCRGRSSRAACWPATGGSVPYSPRTGLGITPPLTRERPRRAAGPFRVASGISGGRPPSGRPRRLPAC